MIRSLTIAATLLAVSIFSASAQNVPTGADAGSLREVLNVADILCDTVVIDRPAQGFAISGRYGFSLHDAGQCVVIDLKKRRAVNVFTLDGNTGHCNNASFGRERYSSRSQFPLLYVSECRGGRVCYVNDITTEGSRLVQTIYYDGEECNGPMDWCVDAPNGMIYIYCTIGKVRMFKRFRLPRLSDSDDSGEVHLRAEDSLGSIPVGDVVIPQGSLIVGRTLYLLDGIPPRDCKLHVVDIVSARHLALMDLNSVALEPEAAAVKGRWLYLSFHTPRAARDNRIFRTLRRRIR